MVIIGKVLGDFLSSRIADPATLTLTAFVVLSIPPFLTATGSLLGREGVEPDRTWVNRLASVLVVVVTVATVNGYFNDGVLLVLLAVLPALIWWFVATRANTPPSERPPPPQHRSIQTILLADRTPSNEGSELVESGQDFVSASLREP